MKNLKKVLMASVMVVSVASADCCVTSCCVATKCVKEVVKMVPYQVCETVCVPVTDSCGNIVCYKTVKKTVTKYKKVVQKVTVDCCCCS